MTRSRMERRKNQADAIEFLHQYRAGVQIRHSLGQNNNDNDNANLNVDANENENTNTNTITTSRWSLSPSNLCYGRRPDARASVYCYTAYPMHHSEKKDHNNATVIEDNYDDHDDDGLLLPIIVIPDIDKNSICFESTFKALGNVGKEASQIPLPDDDDDDDGYNNCCINNNKEESNFEEALLFDTLQSLAEEAARTPLPSDDNIDQKEDREVEENYDVDDNAKGRHLNSLSIIDGLTDVDVEVESERGEEKEVQHVSSLHKSYTVGDSLPTSSFIPFESFLKLGEKQIMESFGGCSNDQIEKFTTTIINKSNSDDDDDDSSSIPGEYFLNLGLSMMSNNNMVTSKDEDENENNKDEDENEIEDNNVDDKILLREKENQYTVAPKLGLKDLLPIPITIPIRIEASQTRMTHRSTNKDHDDTSAIRESKSLSFDRNVDIHELINDGTIAPSSVRNEDSEGKSDTEILKIDGNITEQSKSLCDGNDGRTINKIYVINVIKDYIRVRNGINIEDLESDTCFSREGNQDQSVDITEMDVEHENKPKKSNLTATKNDDNKKLNCINNTHKGDNKKHKEAQPILNDCITIPFVPDTHPREIRRDRNRKKKKGKGYYPSSSLFVSRQFLSR